MSQTPSHSTRTGEPRPRHEKIRREVLRYALAVGLVLVAFGATAAIKQGTIKHGWTVPNFMFFVPALAIAAWRLGRGPTVLATALSLFLINYFFLPPVGSLNVVRSEAALDNAAFLVLAATIAIAMEGLRRARRVAESRAVELERVARRASKLLEVTTALSEARSVEDVAGVVLSKGLATVEAARGVLVNAEGERVELLGARGYAAELEARVLAISRDADVPLMHALRTGDSIWIESAEEYQRRYPWAFERFGAVSDTQAHVAMPLIHDGVTVGGLSLSFEGSSAFGVTDRAFTLLLVQATAAALYRASSYNAERQKRQQAEVLARARADVLGIVAHDLRNPLNLIGGTNQLLAEESVSDAQRAKLLDTMQRAVKQMNRLIADLLDTVRLQAGRLSLDVEDVPVDTILRQAEETFRPLAESRRIQLVIARAEDDIAVRADPLRVSQVLGNLLGNALKFTPAEGTVTLRPVRDDTSVVFQVTDSGPGIPSSDIPHLFEDFWQARKSDSRGVGLGLAIVKGLVEALGGTIGVTSTVGEGSTFSFSLPVAVTSPAAQQSPWTHDVSAPVSRSNVRHRQFDDQSAPRAAPPA